MYIIGTFEKELNKKMMAIKYAYYWEYIERWEE